MKFSFTPAEFVTPSPVSWSLLGNKLFSGGSSELPSVGTCAIDHHPGFFSFFLASPAANRAVGTNNTSKHICRKEREAEIRDKAHTDKGGGGTPALQDLFFRCLKAVPFVALLRIYGQRCARGMFHEHKGVDLRQPRNFEFVGFSLSASLKSARQRENLILGVTDLAHSVQSEGPSSQAVKLSLAGSLLHSHGYVRRVQ